MTNTVDVFCSECGDRISTDGMITYINKGPVCKKCSFDYKPITTESVLTNWKSIICKSRQIRDILQKFPQSTTAYENTYEDGVHETLLWLIGEIPDEDFYPLQKVKDF